MTTTSRSTPTPTNTVNASTNNCNTHLSSEGTGNHLDKSDTKSLLQVVTPGEAAVDVDHVVEEEREEQHEKEDKHQQEDDDEERQDHHQQIEDRVNEENASDNDCNNHRSQQCGCGFVDFTLNAVSSFLRNRKKEYLLGKITSYSVHISLYYAPDDIKADREFILKAVQKCGLALKFASDKLKADREIVMAAVQRGGYALEYSSDELKADKDVVMAAVQEDYRALEYASDELKADKDIVMAAVQEDADALNYALGELKADKEFVFAAVQRNGFALKYASEELKAYKEVVIAALQNSAGALRYASDDLKADREIVLKAVQKDENVLEHVSNKIWDDKEFVLKVVQINGDLLQKASEIFRSDKEVVIAAVKQKPTALKFAMGGMNQDPDCLKAAGLFDDNYDTLKLKNAQRIVLSTKFSLGENTSSYATLVALLMKQDPYFELKVVYSPNAWDKNTCDPNWTDINFPCRGTEETCKKYEFKDNLPVEKECCWRSSYRYQLMKGKETGGFMVQVAKFDEKSQKHVLGNGQQIETELAKKVGLKVFRVYQQLIGLKNENLRGVHSDYGISELIDELVKCAESWYENGCSDMSVTEVRLRDDIKKWSDMKYYTG